MSPKTALPTTFTIKVPHGKIERWRPCPGESGRRGRPPQPELKAQPRPENPASGDDRHHQAVVAAQLSPLNGIAEIDI